MTSANDLPEIFRKMSLFVRGEVGLRFEGLAAGQAEVDPVCMFQSVT
jgi:hypothetical protein